MLVGIPVGASGLPDVLMGAVVVTVAVCVVGVTSVVGVVVVGLLTGSVRGRGIRILICADAGSVIGPSMRISRVEMKKARGRSTRGCMMISLLSYDPLNNTE